MAEEQGSVQPVPADAASPSFTLFGRDVNRPSFIGGRQLGIIVAAAVALALLIAGLMWLDRATYQAVYPGLSDTDAAAVLSTLESTGIPARVDPTSGAVEVPADQVHQARFALAAEGLPRGGGAGYEFLQESAPIGTSQFMDTVRLRHALETELARSIGSLHVIENARVHLAMERRSAFVRDRIPPTASVVVKLYPGRELNAGQTAAIVHLVATAVPGMEADGVTVIDQLGRMLSEPERAGGANLSLDQLEYARRVESGYVRRIEQILAPLVGIGKVRAEATATIDFSVVERTEERFDDGPRPQIRSEQITRDGTELPPVQGAAGAIANEPAGADDAAAPDAAAATQGRQTATRWIRNYELDKSISHVQVPVGRIQRLTVAVVIDHAERAQENGDVARGPLPAEEMTRITQLVKDAIGFNAERGDSVNVVNSPFQETPVEVTPVWQEGWFLTLGKLASITLVVLLLLLVVVRPLLKNLLKPEAEAGPNRLPNPGMPGVAVGEALAAGPQVDNAGEWLEELSAGPDYKADIRLAQRVAASDPRRAAQVVKRWLENGG
ncbi:MAG: flagellar basal-body MS-ring/collar protein FliF [Pseudomonadota bacterium]